VDGWQETGASDLDPRRRKDFPWLYPVGRSALGSRRRQREQDDQCRNDDREATHAHSFVWLPGRHRGGSVSLRPHFTGISRVNPLAALDNASNTSCQPRTDTVNQPTCNQLFDHALQSSNTSFDLDVI
jgi:hypothetical protein